MEIHIFRTGITILIAFATVGVGAASATQSSSFASSDVAFDHVDYDSDTDEIELDD